ncbi:hypothetical protein Solca_0736 [Solitalea canadensis DSM 3403]|uniref:Uncharacterized protein n=1 Tax=Solitalea canadensis (strain ATCC 29591 / DSM 3403 / JCM 21819 / LMG 8368 / NBRC 15130 / NCIMB 12057 / USAM 9D) TaxID=929556 RepID=H8KPG2_SOLCM|nr:hypothetical protein Solca_0736 [Solitalea canadensis DSM 3403]
MIMNIRKLLFCTIMPFIYNSTTETFDFLTSYKTIEKVSNLSL